MHRTNHRSLAVSRRGFIRRAAATGGTMLGVGLLGSGVLRAGDEAEHEHRAGGGQPKAIPVGFGPFTPFGIFIHHLPPTPGGPLADINEPSHITDFNGFVAVTRFRGGGTGFNTETGETRDLAF